MKKRLFRFISLMLSLIMIMSFPGAVVSVSAANIGFAESEATIYTGTGKELELSGYSGKITWSSSDSSIATVDQSGWVEALSTGNVTITAKTSNGSYQCKIKVLPGWITFAINYKHIDLGETMKVTVRSFSPGGNSLCVRVRNAKEGIISISDVSTQKIPYGSSFSFTVTGKKVGYVVLEAYYKEYPDKIFTDEMWVEAPKEEKKPVVPDKNSQLMKDGDTITVSEVQDKAKKLKSRPIEYSSFFSYNSIADYKKFTNFGKIGIKAPGPDSLSDPNIGKNCIVRLYVYDEKKKVYCLKSDDEFEYTTGYYGRVKVGELDVNKKYYIAVRYYLDGELVFQNTDKVYPCPAATITNDTKTCKVKFIATPNYYDGVEIYEYNEPYYIKRFTDGYGHTVAVTEKIQKKYPDIKLIYRNPSDPANTVAELNGSRKRYLAIRFYRIVNKKKVYTDYTFDYSTFGARALVDSVELKPVAAVSGEELQLVKDFVDKHTNSSMTNEEKLFALLKGLHRSGAKYQTDINKIDGNRPVWQLLVKKEGQCATWAFTTYYVLKYVGFDVRVVRGVRDKRDGGGQHFWCQLTLQGKVYTIDTQFDETPCSEPIESEVFCGYIPQEYFG